MRRSKMELGGRKTLTPLLTTYGKAAFFSEVPKQKPAVTMRVPAMPSKQLCHQHGCFLGRPASGSPASMQIIGWHLEQSSWNRARYAGQAARGRTSAAQRRQERRQAVSCQAAGNDGLSRRELLLASSAAASLSQLQLPGAAGAKVVSKDWQQVKLPLDPGVVLLDIAFTETDPNKGFLLGTRQTLLETTDGGKSWNPRRIEAAQDEGFNYRFNSISFNGAEGFIVGKPAILLHTKDGGSNWERVPLSAKLPGNPLVVTATPGKEGQAEMTTDQGAIYVTDNAGYSWTAAVKETVDATLNRTVSSGISGASYYEGTFANISRSKAGDYVAVSSRGNFYLTWTPGADTWQPHNRPSPRRVQNMGWTPANELWLSVRGGDLLISAETGAASEKFDKAKLGSRGFGILDVGFKNDQEGFACGGSGTLFKTMDGGKTWQRDRSTDQIAGNLYAVKYTPSGTGFILGNDGILLRNFG